MRYITLQAKEYLCHLIAPTLIALLTVCVGSLVKAQVSAPSAFQLPSGGVPSCFASLDLDGDGYPDMVMSSKVDSAIAVLYNKKGTRFGDPVVSKVRVAPDEMVLGDVNGDGIPDVVGICGSAGAIVFLGAKDGTFKECRDYVTGPDPVSLALADLNDDHKLDLIVLDSKLAKVVVRLGNGDGTFGAPTSYDAGNSPTAVRVADVTGDHIPDLVIATNDAKDSNDEVMILPGKGDESFGAPIIIRLEESSGAQAAALAVGDLNNDGLCDIVAVYGHGTGDTISVLLGNAKGGFTEQTVSGGIGISQIVLTDCDGDGIPDIVALNRDGATVSVILNRNHATSFVRHDYVVTPCPLFMAVADFDKDRFPDVFCFSYLKGRLAYSMLKGSRGGALTATPSIPLGMPPFGIAVGDFNGDKVDDVVAFSREPGGDRLLLGDGKGGFIAAANPIPDLDSFPYAFAVGDFNGDGKLDLAVLTAGPFWGLTIYLGNGDGTFTRGPSSSRAISFESPVTLVAVDLNHDGKDDLLLGSGEGDVHVLISNGDGSFRLTDVLKGSSFIASIALGDVNGIKTGELAVLDTNSGDGYVRLYQSGGNGKFKYINSIHVGGDATFVALHDINGDGQPDLLVTTGSPTQSTLNIFTASDGAYDFNPAQVYNVGAGARYCVIRDFDGDGVPDILTACYYDDSVCFLKGLGGGRFGPAVVLEGGYQPNMIAIADAGGSPDLLVSDSSGRAIAVVTAPITKRNPMPDPHLSTVSEAGVARL